MLIAFQKIMKKYVIPSLLSMSLFLVSVMALILSIPENVRASQIDATQRIHYLYQGYYYDFVPDDTIPTNYEFNSETLEYVIEKEADFLNSWITQKYGKIINWVVNTFVVGIYSLCRNIAIATSNMVDADPYSYKWGYSFTGIEDNDSPYGPKYGFKFTGIFFDEFTLVLDRSGSIWGSTPIGNITASNDQMQMINQIAPQFDPDEIFVPVSNLSSFNNLKQPYIDGKSLHFFGYDSSGNEFHYMLEDFSNTSLISVWNQNTDNFQLFFLNLYNNQKRNYTFHNLTNNTVSTKQTDQGRFNYNNWRSFNIPTTSGYACYWNPAGVSINLPTFWSVTSALPTITTNNSLGRINRQNVAGVSDIYLYTLSTTPTSIPANPNPVPIDVPIPVTEIPEDPEDPIPQSPDPDPVPGIPVNPTPPSLRPVPSIVSGNDDLWPSVVELQNIEIDLSGYLSGLGDYSFPDLSVITESFAGSIVWVSAIMSTLFNGSDFSILFAVLSSFFIVAALLGLYKWWNHK